MNIGSFKVVFFIFPDFFFFSFHFSLIHVYLLQLLSFLSSILPCCLYINCFLFLHYIHCLFLFLSVAVLPSNSIFSLFPFNPSFFCSFHISGTDCYNQTFICSFSQPDEPTKFFLFAN